MIIRRKKILSKNNELNKLNMDRLICFIHDNIEKIVKPHSKNVNPNTEETRNKVKQRIEDFLDSLEERDVINNSNISVRSATWSDIYSSKLKRIWAIVSYKTLKMFKIPLENSNPKWYHHFFPYKIQTLPNINLDMLMEDIEQCETIEEAVAKVNLKSSMYAIGGYYAEFETPYYKMITDLSLIPVSSAEYISFNTIISKSKDN